MLAHTPINETKSSHLPSVWHPLFQEKMQHPAGNPSSPPLSLKAVTFSVLLTFFLFFFSFFAEGHGKVNLTLLLATTLGFMAPMAATLYRRCRKNKPENDPSIAPGLERTESGYAAKLEKFSHYVGKENHISVSLKIWLC